MTGSVNTINLGASPPLLRRFGDRAFRGSACHLRWPRSGPACGVAAPHPSNPLRVEGFMDGLIIVEKWGKIGKMAICG
jgi:hypothetical protein